MFFMVYGRTLLLHGLWPDAASSWFMAGRCGSDAARPVVAP
jgi:hypothetical protein